MPTAIRIWEVAGKALQPAESTLAHSHVEAELENWIAASPQTIGDGLLIVDRQRDVPGVGRQGQLDVWTKVKSLAEVAGKGEDYVRSALQKQPVLDMQLDDCWIRLTSVEHAEALVTQLLALVQQSSGATA